MNYKKIVPDVLAIVAFVLLSLAYFFPADIEGRVLFQHDTSAGVGAGQESARYYEQTGERTRWTNSIFGGMPTYQISPSYGSTDVLHGVSRAYQLFTPPYVCLVLMMLTGFYILLRTLGLGVWMAALGSVFWAFSSYFFILISAGHIWKFVTLAYIPPTIAGLMMVYRGKLLRGGLLFALFTALQIMSNHVQMSYYFLFVMLFLVGAFLEQAIRNRALPQFLKASAVLLAAGAVGVAINLSNLYHTYTYSKETMRGKSELAQTGDAAKQTSSGLNRDYITQWSYGVDETLTLLVPNLKGGASVPLSESEKAMQKADPQYTSLYGSLTQYFGDQPMTSGPVYVGAFVLFLFFLGCQLVKGPVKWALIGATLFSVVLSWGRHFMPLTDFFIDYVPLYNKFRAVSSILVIAEFTIPLLAILGLKKVMDEPEVLKKQKGAPFLISLALTAGVALLIWLMPDAFTSFVPEQEKQMLQSAVDSKAIPAEMLGGILANLAEMRKALVTADALRSLLIVLTGAALVFLYAGRKLSRNLTLGAIGLLCLLDLWTVNKRYLNDEQFVDGSITTTTFTKTAADEAILQDQSPDYRVLNFATNTFNENNTAYWHKSVGGYHAAKLRRYQELIDRYIAPQMQAAYNEVAQAGGNMDSLDASKFRVLNMLNAKYFIFATGGQGQTTALINPHAYGNAWFVSKVDYADNANEEMETLGKIDLRREAVADARFKEALNGARTLTTDSAATITLKSYAPNRLTYESQNAHEGVAVFSEIYYPQGWQVSVDGKEVPLARANYVLRSLYLPAGKHTIEMTFDPKSLHTTETVAWTSILLLLVWAVAALVPRGRMPAFGKNNHHKPTGQAS